MEPEQKKKKRARPVPNSSQRSKKRQKLVSVKVTSQVLPNKPVALDALPWQEVEMPEMFDDAEGFYDLEEVEGVEIIRDGGTLQFVGFLALHTGLSQD